MEKKKQNNYCILRVVDDDIESPYKLVIYLYMINDPVDRGRHSVTYGAPEGSCEIHNIIAFPRNTIAFPRNNIAFFRYVIPFSRNAYCVPS